MIAATSNVKRSRLLYAWQPGDHQIVRVAILFTRVKRNIGTRTAYVSVIGDRPEQVVSHSCKIKQTNSVTFSPQAKYTD
jgi:hypothetical protein